MVKRNVFDTNEKATTSKAMATHKSARTPKVTSTPKAMPTPKATPTLNGTTKSKTTTSKPMTKKNPKEKADEQDWYCAVCQMHEISDMRLCSVCRQYVHEDCVGLTKENKDIFVCPLCE